MCVTHCARIRNRGGVRGNGGEAARAGLSRPMEIIRIFGGGRREEEEEEDCVQGWIGVGADRRDRRVVIF